MNSLPTIIGWTTNGFMVLAIVFMFVRRTSPTTAYLSAACAAVVFALLVWHQVIDPEGWRWASMVVWAIAAPAEVWFGRMRAEDRAMEKRLAEERLYKSRYSR